METLKARVINGHLVLNEPTELPEGTEIELTLAEPGDDLTAEERAELHAALEESWASVKAGKVHPAEELLRKLRPDR